ncbi:hypothetical protein ACFFX1_04440 [Dactylosporangium sucinum]|uniref:Uncharacterized protein n=1 Tax=Dactylosporangium sucinum TaxID=1424081 RepID=A0A917U5N3_9ACTN|nr:hypothetical protein [Dactylosporangium sucinum]GGM59656.1 hypothetical protein GCM10007977_071530 [Dactylosporangium sucinum]
MQQEQRGSLDETYVPEPRRGEHDDRDDHDVAVGTAHPADREDTDAGPDREEAYPAGTYVSGTSRTDDDRADAEVVDRDEALEAERVEEAEDRDVLADHDGRDAIGERVDEDVAAERAEEETAEAEAAEDRRWQAGVADDRDVYDLGVQPVDEARDEDDDARTDTYADSDTLTEAEATGPETVEELRPGAVEPEPLGAFWADGAVDGLRERWRELQLRFIDDPRSVAGEADRLVAEAAASIAASLEEQRRRLADWQDDGGDDTERLRAAVRRYRDFLDRLLGL